MMNLRNLAVAFAFLLGLGSPLGAEQTVVLDSCQYGSLEAARLAWRPIDDNTSPVELTSDQTGRTLLKLPCSFSAHDDWRVGWDLSGQWDLSGTREILIEAVADSSKQAAMTLYLHTRNGWYRMGFRVPEAQRTIRLKPKQFKLEGTPDGWDKIDRIRLSVARGEGEDREILIGRLAVVTADTRVAVYCNDPDRDTSSAIDLYVRRTCDSLDRLSIGYDIISNEQVAAGVLAGKKVLILPPNPVLDTPAGQAVKEFLAGEGKLIGCGELSEQVLGWLGVRLGGVAPGGPDELDTVHFEPTGGEAPANVRQRAREAYKILPSEGTRVVGRWVDRQGKPTNVPAITRNANGYYFGAPLSRFCPYDNDELLLRMVGRCAPGLLQHAYETQLSQLGRLGGLGGPKDLAAAVEAMPIDSPNRAEANEQLKQANMLLADARAEADRKDWRRALELMRQVHLACMRAYALSLLPETPEKRAVWCHKPRGVEGMTWDEAAEHLAANGFNMLIANMLWGGGAAYDSKVLPVIPEAVEYGDQLTECAAAAKKHGLALHVWKVNWRLGGRTTEEFRRRMRQAGRLQVNLAGETVDWLCPTQRENMKLELDSMLEVVSNYDIAGVHMDYIRYPNRETCFCPRCRTRFESIHGAKVDNWPGDVASGELRDEYNRFRRHQITRLVAAVSEKARIIKPAIQISAAVFWDWPGARQDVAQDWVLWARKGYVDFVCPMQYTATPEDFEYQTKATIRWAGGVVPVLPGIGATLGQRLDQTLQQVLITRKYNAGGFVLFEYYPVLAEYHLPLLGMGATSR